MSLVKYPFGPATKLAPDHSAAHSITIDNMLTFISLSGMTANATVALVPAEGLEEGAEVVIDVTQGATGRNITPSTNCVAPALTGVTNDRDTITLKWNGTAFVGGAWAKVVDAG